MFAKISVLHFATKLAAVKLEKPWMLSHFSESKYPSYVGSAMCPYCPTEDWQGKSGGYRGWLLKISGLNQAIKIKKNQMQFWFDALCDFYDTFN